jgi:hypothetical protein
MAGHKQARRRSCACAKYVPLQPWIRGAGSSVADELAHESAIDQATSTAIGQRAVSIVRTVVAAGGGHADVYAALAPARVDALRSGDDFAIADVDLTFVWYQRARHRALTSRYGCAYEAETFPWLGATSSSEAGFRELLRRGSTRQRHIELPEGVISGLGSLEAHEFGSLVQSNYRGLTDWWLDGVDGGLRKVTDSLTAMSGTTDRPPLGICQYLAPVIGATAGVSTSQLTGNPAVGGFVGTVVGALSQGVLARRRSEPQRVRLRILNAFADRRREPRPV